LPNIISLINEIALICYWEQRKSSSSFSIVCIFW